MITNPEPDILECEVKWALGSIIMNKASGVTEKAMATHSSTLAWKIPGRLQSMGSLGVRHD